MSDTFDRIDIRNIKQEQEDKKGKKFGSVIHVCHDCGKVDIDPETHDKKCDPEAEHIRQENNEYYD